MNVNLDIILASGSPRRQSLMTEAGFNFSVLVKPVDENFPSHLKREEVAVYLANKKASAYDHEISENKTIITADTIVVVDDTILGKPADYDDAFTMLKILSGREHEVITGVCIKNKHRKESFHVITQVTFRQLTNEEITRYINHFKPFDKAGGYGIQEWIGLIAITGIRGSYNNVVGLPVAELYAHLISFNAAFPK